MESHTTKRSNRFELESTNAALASDNRGGGSRDRASLAGRLESPLRNHAIHLLSFDDDRSIVILANSSSRNCVVLEFGIADLDVPLFIVGRTLFGAVARRLFRARRFPFPRVLDGARFRSERGGGLRPSLRRRFASGRGLLLPWVPRTAGPRAEEGLNGRRTLRG